MKYGTLLCWLFGHKCIFKWRKFADDGDRYTTGVTQLEFCVRCGAKK